MNIRAYCMCAAVIILSSCSIPGVWNENKAVESGTGDIVIDQEHLAASGAFLEESEDTCASFRGDEQDHCYQQEAWEKGDFLICREIQGERFAHITGNPPRDKCFSMVAAKKCDPTICDFIQGGQRYFSPTECKQRISRDCP